MRKLIVIRTQFEAIHNWIDCDILEVDFLRFPHRHIFYVTIKFTVRNNNREIEFLTFKKQLDKYISRNFGSNVGSMSCEDIAEKLLNKFDASFVSVFEDNENGAEVYAD